MGARSWVRESGRRRERVPMGCRAFVVVPTTWYGVIEPGCPEATHSCLGCVAWLDLATTRQRRIVFMGLFSVWPPGADGKRFPRRA
jgi:hypothetical protein